MTPTADEDRDAPEGRSAGGEGSGPPWDSEMAPGSAGEADADETSGDPAGDESDGDGVAGEFVPEGPVEPEEPVLEHAVAILVGALVTILATGELVVADYGLETMALLAGGTVLAGLVLFGYFGLFDEIRALIADRTP